ncbi:hypothetical protein ALP29_200801 [Pseudomonas syringae pv. avii]|uniref:Uncharacterized protein n=1 Tax=Pseudomonas syringae pv. avii TaxID=663959 RepID=A0A3M5TZV1_PSESX|nr:hypothetical protein ALP29_200801 [Pseudomonas syringae pv. avii]
MRKPWLVRVGAFLYLQVQEKTISMVDDCLSGTNSTLFTVNVTVVVLIFLVYILKCFLMRYRVKTQYGRYSRRYAHEEGGRLGILRKFSIGILSGINAAASGELHYLHAISGEDAARRDYLAFKHFHYFGGG